MTRHGVRRRTLNAMQDQMTRLVPCSYGPRVPGKVVSDSLCEAAKLGWKLVRFLPHPNGTLYVAWEVSDNRCK